MVEYVGEHAALGVLGELLIIVSFGAALFSAIAYLLSYIRKEDAFRQMGRIGFWLHSIALVGAAATLFYLLFNRYFEFDYVWKHANSDMPLRYIFSCFWEGQEGSFLLWSFWHVVLGNILLRTARKWESLTMFTVAILQVLLGSMVLGVFIFDFQIGSNPFTLIRELPENVGLPWTRVATYLQDIPTFQNGRGLNPLLQNYWMTIHPPTLFLGYASLVVPFAFAVAGAWTGELREWLRPAIPWAFFSVSVLGIGILMGGAWAYEALSFGGFWAWDPVENASLIPWIMIVGAAHVMVLNHHKPKSLYAALLLTLAAYALVMYASFLVHSGVLGETSVHSFTGNGLMAQHLFILLSITGSSVALLLFQKQLRLIFLAATIFLAIVAAFTGAWVAIIVAFLGMAVVMLIIGHSKTFPKSTGEEPLWSREFWLFIGAVVLVLAAGQIAIETSKPIWNLLAQPFSKPLMSLANLTGIDGLKALAEGKLAPHSERIAFFNKWQVPFAFVITFLIACTQFLRYGKGKFGQFVKKIAWAFGISILLTAAAQYFLEYSSSESVLLILLFTCIFAVVANSDYLIRMLKGKFDFAGASVAHIGFALILLGALISTSRSMKISENGSRFDIAQLNEDFKNNEDILLFKGDTVEMGPYFVRYHERQKTGVNVYYTVDYYAPRATYYKAGQKVISRGAIFEALVDHKPGPDFIMDQKNWELVEDPRSLDVETITRWSSNRPGDYLFTLNPRVQLNPEFGNVAEPATKRYLNRDIYSHIRWAELEEDNDPDGFRTPEELKLAVGDTAFVGANLIRLNALSMVKPEEKANYRLAENDLAVRASIGIRNGNGDVFEIEPLYILRDTVLPIPDPVIESETGLRFNFEKIDPQTGIHTFQVSESNANRREFIVMQAIQFPMINVLWIGCIVMFLGTVMAIRHRIRISRKLLRE